MTESPSKLRPASDLSNTKASYLARARSRKLPPPRAGDHDSATSIHQQSKDLRRSVEDSQRNSDQHRTGGLSVPVAATLPTAQPEDIRAADKQQSKAARYQELQATYQELQVELQQANKTIETLNAEKKTILEEWHHAVDDLHNLQSECDCRIADDVFLSSWKNLCYDIKNWAATYFTGKSRRILWRWGSKPDFSRLSKDHETFMKSNGYRYFLIQAFLWQRLIANVFDDSWAGLYWADYTHNDLRLIQNHLNPYKSASSNHSKDTLETRLKEYHTWRAKTTQLLLAQESPDHKHGRINELVNKLSGDLQPFANSKSLDDKFNTLLKGIVTDAVDLDSKMKTQKAVFTPKLYFKEERGFGFPFDSSSMESIDESLASTESADESKDTQKPLPVELVVSPALFKAGNSMAEEYQTHHVLVNAQVICTQLVLTMGKPDEVQN